MDDRFWKKELGELGYTVLTAGAPGEAIQVARKYNGKINLLMTDVIIPQINERYMAENLISIYPHLKSLFMSGYTADVIAQHGVLEDGLHFIQKPFSLPALAVKVREAVD